RPRLEVARAERVQKDAPGGEPRVHAGEQRREALSRHVVEDVERDAGVEGRLRELELGEVRLDRLDAAGEPKLRGRDVDPRDAEAACKPTGFLAGSAAELEDARPVGQQRLEQGEPLLPRGVDDPMLPVVEAAGDALVALAHDVGHGTVSTSISPAAASARSRASMFVAPRAIT